MTSSASTGSRRPRTRRRVAGIASVALACGLALVPGSADAKTGAMPYDFDGDGHPDLVVGAPALNRGSIREAGGIVVLPTPSGRPRIITQSTRRVAGGSEPGDHFGAALASADFDGDGYADLAVGIPGEDLKGKPDAGAVTILYGTAKGLTGIRSTQVSEPSGKQAWAGFGSALAAGDLDGDHYPDLAVGAPWEDGEPGVSSPSGAVTVLPGGPRGVGGRASSVLRGVRGTTPAENGDAGSADDSRFGSALEIADVDGRDSTDLVVVSRGIFSGNDDIPEDPGSVSVCSVSRSGPSWCRRLLHRWTLGSVVVGNVQGDPRPEIVVTADVGYFGETHVGAVGVLTLSGSGGTTSAEATRFHAPDLGLPSSTKPDPDEPYDPFARFLTLGRLNGDAYDDLVVGTDEGPWRSKGGGWVGVVHGGRDGLATSGNVVYEQDTAGVPGHSEDGDRFGAAAALLDRNGDGRADLVVGAPGEDGSGRITTLLATPTGFTTRGARTVGLKEIAPRYDNRSGAAFGSILGR